MSLRLLLLKMRVTNESFRPSEKILVANDLLKSMQRGSANPEVPFFRISGGTPKIIKNSNLLECPYV
jgi:hypothetical protein